MCMISYVGDAWSKTVPPWTEPWRGPNQVTPLPEIGKDVTRAEFEALRAEIQELRTLLLAAKAFDEATGQPDCEVEEKVGLIKRLAELVGIDLSDVFDE